MRVGNSGAQDGRAWFDGNGKVTSVTTEIINQGPVFIDLHITYTFEGESDGSVAALPLELGKQVHNWEPNKPPREEVEKRAYHYELKLRFAMGDPWIEVNERYHLPRDGAIKPWGIHQYWMQATAKMRQSYHGLGKTIAGPSIPLLGCVGSSMISSAATLHRVVETSA